MATSLVTFHIASNAESLSTANVSASERFLTGVAVGVNAQARWAGESFVTRATYVSVLVLGIWRSA